MKLFSKLTAISCLLMFAIFAISISGCKKILNAERQGGYNPEDYPYPGGSGPYDQFIFSAYNQLRSFDLHSQAFIAVTSIRSDDADKGSNTTDGGADAQTSDNFPIAASNGYCNKMWIGNYDLINKCNSTIKEINTNVLIVAADAIKNQTIGEARFLRAYAYFNLVRMFGKVPLIDSLYSDPAKQNNVLQSNVSTLYSFIEGDLMFAAANLPISWDPSKFPGRLTSGAANGLLAKVYLTQKKWAEAMATANIVTSSGLYDLTTTYDKIFREEGENSKESIFEVQATASSKLQKDNGVQYAQIQGVRGTDNWNLGWGFNTPSINLDTSYEKNDPRRTRTILFLSRRGQGGQQDTLFSTIYGEVTPFYSTPTSCTYPNLRYNQKVYSNPAMRSSVGGQAGRESYWMNLRLLRYADIVLMFAEAANELGGDANITAAKNALNSVRARARMGAPAGTLPNVITADQAELRNAIRKERRFELAMEHDRFFDLVRWGIAQDALHAVGKTNFSNNRDVLLPIPQVQIDLSGNKLKQNDGY